MISKISSSAALAALLLIHGDLLELAWILATFNVLTALSQYLGWKKYASDRVGFSFKSIDRNWALRLTKYGSVLSIWTVAMLFISGLDMVIVGHYAYAETGYYGIATSVTNFMVLVIGSLFSPLLPAISSQQSQRTPDQIGELTIRATRYCTLLVCLLSLPLLLGAYPVLKVWVGRDYAVKSAVLLQFLVLGNAIRQLGQPYALAVVATGKQHLATVGAVAEAMVNVCISIYLVQKIGAVGVAVGTVVGAVVSVATHLGISMRLTRSTISMSRGQFVAQGFLRPSVCILPSLLLIPIWDRNAVLPVNPFWIAIWTGSTLSIAWLTGLTSEDRQSLRETRARLALRGSMAR